MVTATRARSVRRALLCSAAMIVAATAMLTQTGRAAGTGLRAAATSLCGTRTGTATYAHIVVIMDENVSFKQLNRSPQAPYLKGLTAQCGSETFMHAATHPSPANYMAVTGGATTGEKVHSTGGNIFSEADVAGLSWKVYAESMPTACATQKLPYVTDHNPPFWYADLAAPSKSCMTNDVPMYPGLTTALTNDTLPRFSMLIPNDCDDMHGLDTCLQPTSDRIGAGDTWLSTMIPKLTALPSYRAGRTLVVITWDEGNGPEILGSDCTSPAVYSKQPSCQIPTIVISPYIRAGAHDGDDHNLYGLLGDIEDMLGVPRLAHAVGQPSLRPGLGF